MLNRLMKYNKHNEGVYAYLDFKYDLDNLIMLPRSVGKFTRYQDIPEDKISDFEDYAKSHQFACFYIPSQECTDRVVTYVNETCYVVDEKFLEFLKGHINASVINTDTNTLRIYKDIPKEKLVYNLLYLDDIEVRYRVIELNKDMCRIYVVDSPNVENVLFRTSRRHMLLKALNNGDDEKVKCVLESPDYKRGSTSVITMCYKGDYKFVTNITIDSAMNRELKENELLNDKAYNMYGEALGGYYALYRRGL